MMKLKAVLPVVLLALLAAACKKDAKIQPAQATPVTPPATTTPTTPTTSDKEQSAVFNFAAFVNGAALAPNTWYTNANADSFTVSHFNYYISNIKFKKADGSVFAEPESYHIIKHLENLQSFTVNDIPEGAYTSVEFLIGVDSLRNVSGAQQGALDVTQGMFWDWNTGYVFFKLEGLCKTAMQPFEKDFSMHVGGYSGANNNLQSCSINFTQQLQAQHNHQAILTFHTHVEEIFMNPVTLSFDSYNAVSGGKQAKTVAGNYKDMFELYSLQN